MSEKGKLVINKYKHLLMAITIIIIVIILDIILENYSKESTKKVSKRINEIYEILEQKEENYDVKKLGKLSDTSIRELKERTSILTCFIEHEEVEKISMKLEILNSEIKNKNWEDAKTTTSEIKQLVKYLDVKHKFSLQNLF